MLHLETSRLVVKTHTIANLQKFHQYENDPELLYYNDDGPDEREPETLDQTTEYLKRIIDYPADSNKIYFAIHKKENDIFFGYGMIAFINRNNRSCVVGIVIGEKTEWGKGYAHEALNSVITYCFKIMNMNRIGAGVYDFNHRSRKLFEGLGFKQEGIIRQAVWKRDKFSDEIQYGLLREEWQKER